MAEGLSDTHVMGYTPLITPNEIKAQFPITDKASQTVLEARQTIEAILDGRDPRRFLVVGPCSIHNPKEAMDYAVKLKELADNVRDEFYVVMRGYFEKPRTVTGWKGLIVDPHLNDTFDMEEGLKIARKLLLGIAELGLPVGTEALYPQIPPYLSDLVTWYTVGARTIEAQTHREMASGLSTPVGFKNGTDGSIDTAINAIKSAMTPHSFLGIDTNGRNSIVKTVGNKYGHLILRGGTNGSNYSAEHVKAAAADLKNAGLNPRIVVDCSHGNSNKDYRLQPAAFHDLISQIMEDPASPVVGIMLESNLNEGNQKINGKLQYGVSVTDPCINFLTTEEIVIEARRRIQHHRLLQPKK